MSYATTRDAMNQKRMQMFGLRSEIQQMQAAIEPQPVDDFVFETVDGPWRLSEMFGEKTDLFAIHNMGAVCLYCTLWADGFNGVYAHLADRAAFVVTSPDAPVAQRRFAESRGWRFPMASLADNGFAAEMGYFDPKSQHGDGYLPGVSVFQKKSGQIVRVSDTPFGPGDDFCSIFSLFSMLPEGIGDWQPRFKYRSQSPSVARFAPD